jgi:hypothetical protein
MFRGLLVDEVIDSTAFHILGEAIPPAASTRIEKRKL